MLLAAGLAGGVATLFRFDCAPAVVLSLLSLGLIAGRRALVRVGAGLAVAAVLYALHAILIGGAAVSRVVTDLVNSQPGRTLPLPSADTANGALLVAGEVGVAVALIAGVLALRRARRDLPGGVLLSVGIFSAALLPYALSRPDTGHLVTGTLVPIAMVPVAIGVLLGLRRTGPAGLRPAMRSAVLPGALVLYFAISPATSIDNAFTVAGKPLNSRHPPAWKARGGGHSLLLDDPKLASNATAVASELNALARTGQSVFVGPVNMRRSNYADTFMYFLMPKLRPASYYLELNPWTASRPGSGFANEIAHADFLVLTARWDPWGEPNVSQRYGSPLPNQVVAREFRVVASAGPWFVYRRVAAPVLPAPSPSPPLRAAGRS
jgi:hypothetical protein